MLESLIDRIWFKARKSNCFSARWSWSCQFWLSEQYWHIKSVCKIVGKVQLRLCFIFGCQYDSM